MSMSILLQEQEQEQQQELKQVQKQELKASYILRTHGKRFKQIKRVFSDRENGRCALGVIYSYFGWSGGNDIQDRAAPYYAVKAHRLIEYDASTISEMNDDGKTFDEIADWLEGVGH
jgi:hypothetical protein